MTESDFLKSMRTAFVIESDITVDAIVGPAMEEGYANDYLDNGT